MPAADRHDELILVLAPLGRDGRVTAALLRDRGLDAEVCSDAADAERRMAAGAGALLVTEEALEGAGALELFARLRAQPTWSELPLIILTRGTDSHKRLLDLAAEAAGGVTLLERPLGVNTLLYTIEVALRSRRRQYQVRDLLEQQHRQTAALNASRVAALNLLDDAESARHDAERSADALRRSREDLDRAQEVGNIGSWRLDVRQNALVWSNQTHRIFGVPKGTPLSYETFLSAVHPDDRALVDGTWQAALRGGPYDLEHRIVTDGSIRWVREKAYLEFAGDGSLLGGFGIVQDITDRKGAEEALRKLNDELEERVAERTQELLVTRNSLQTERQRLFSVLETLPVYVILLDKDYHIPFANRFFRERFGESNGRRCYEYLFKRSEPCENCETYTVRRTNAPHHWYWTGPDDRNYDIYDYPFIDSDGSTLILEMGIDITDQKLAQEALQETITELREATRRTELTSALLALITQKNSRREYLDATCDLLHTWSGLKHVGVRVTDPNRKVPFESCRGYDPAFLEQESDLTLQKDRCICTRVIAGTPDPADARSMTAKGSFFTGDSLAFVDRLTEEEKGRYRGTCMKYLYRSLAVIPILYREKTIGAVHLADDRPGMLSRTTIEFLEELAQVIGEAVYRFSVEEERIRLASALESTVDGVVVTRPEDGTIEYVNPAFEQITGYTKNEVIGQTLHLLDSGRQDEGFFENLRDVLHRDGVWRGQLVNRKKDGTLYFEDCSFSPVRDVDGHIINYVSVKRDVTEKLRMESIAESVSMMDNIGSVFAGVRHEIGNPINNAKMMLTVLQQKQDSMPAERVREYIGRSLNEIGRVEHLLKTLRTFNLFETPALEDVATGPLLELFLGLVGKGLEDRGIAITTQVLPGAERVRADARVLQHVLLNVTMNAADALQGRTDPRISITLSRGDSRVRIRVSDNGIGMDAAQLENLFKPFHTTKPNGTGLGLVIVKKMLSAMNGTIEFESRRGSGTIVNIHLPGAQP